ncbi:MAG: PAS domain-containing protein [Sulfuritalea sp.]|nr:PAS domain-containing protein [Sulfuritalea sp.]
MSESTLIDVSSHILDGSPVPAFVIDSNHVVTHWNKALARMSGIPAKDVLGTHHQWRAFYPAHRPVLADIVVDGAPQILLDKFYRGKYRQTEHCPGGWESEDFFPAFGEGCWLAFSAAPIRNSEGNIVGCIETLQDITERKEAENARREAERRLTEIVAGSPVAMFVLDADCKITHWNKACESLTNSSAEEMLGKNEAWRAFYPYDTRRVVLAELIVRRAEPEELAAHYGGRARPSKLVAGAFEADEFFPTFGEGGKWLHFMAAPLHNLRGDVVGAIETLVDLGAEKESK